MKYRLVFLFSILFSIPAFAQQEIREKLYSHVLRDTVYYHVMVPEKRDPAEQLPVLYAMKYGMIDGPYIASQLRYFRSAGYPVLNMLVVTVLADMDRIGFVYNTGLLTAPGLQFLGCLKNEVFADVQRKYNTSDFRAYIGHSYAASYANYIFQHEPGMFNGYILLAPEKAGMDTALDKKANNRETFYYTAVGEFDMERRHAYAKDNCNKLAAFNKGRLFIKYDSIPRGDHSNILTMAIQPGLEFISQQYNPNADIDPGKNAWEGFRSVAARVETTYGIRVEKNYRWYSRFAQLAISRKDTLSLIQLLDYFHSDKLKGYDTRNFGDYCVQLGLLKRAEQYYRSTIQKALDIPEREGWEIFTLIDCYRALAVNIEKKDREKAWEYLQKALQYGGKDVDIYFLAGAYAVDNAYNVQKGIDYLLQYLRLRKDIIDDIHWSYEKIYTKLGKGYYLLKDVVNARLYLQKSLAINPENREAKELLVKL